MQYLQYTKTVPNRGGWYWISHSNWERPYIVRFQVDDFCGSLYLEYPPIPALEGIYVTEEDNIKFAGPIPEPRTVR